MSDTPRATSRLLNTSSLRSLYSIPHEEQMRREALLSEEITAWTKLLSEDHENVKNTKITSPNTSNPAVIEQIPPQPPRNHLPPMASSSSSNDILIPPTKKRASIVTTPTTPPQPHNTVEQQQQLRDKKSSVTNIITQAQPVSPPSST
eukprot:PhF_6_TR23829/c0_g1_i2/m.33411